VICHFFFQAEDRIRDRNVTGVQTCALPISFFDLLDEWFHDVLILGTTLPRNDTVIRRSMTQALKEDPAFEPLKEEPRFQNMVSKIGRASCRERELMAVGDGAVKKKSR